MVVVHTFNPSTQEAGTCGSEFKANLVYRASSRTPLATQRNAASQKAKTKASLEMMENDHDLNKDEGKSGSNGRLLVYAEMRVLLLLALVSCPFNSVAPS